MSARNDAEEQVLYTQLAQLWLEMEERKSESKDSLAQFMLKLNVCLVALCRGRTFPDFTGLDNRIIAGKRPFPGILSRA